VEAGAESKGEPILLERGGGQDRKLLEGRKKGEKKKKPLSVPGGPGNVKEKTSTNGFT